MLMTLWPPRTHPARWRTSAQQQQGREKGPELLAFLVRISSQQHHSGGIM
jgi:hypothetical protein